jgi:hypothetical protein
MEREKRRLKENKRILYELHGYDTREGTKNVHHIIPKSEGGTSEFENLSLLDKEMHAWIHKLIERIDNNGKRHR